MSKRLSYANVMSTIAVFGVLASGTAYAANTVFSTDIVDGQVKSVDIGDGELGSSDVKDNSINTFDVHSFLGADVVDGSLTSVDVAPGTFVGGRGQLLSNRIVSTPTLARTLLDIPGFGPLDAECFPGFAGVYWTNETGGPVDVWTDSGSPGRSQGSVADIGNTYEIVRSLSGQPAPFTASTTFNLGTGNDPGPRKAATIRVSALQVANNLPCGFQAQGTLWTSP